VQDRLLGEEGVAADRPRLVGRERDRPERRLALEIVLEPRQDRLLLHLGVLALLLDRGLQSLEAPVDHLEIGQDQLGVEILDVALRRRRAERFVGEGPDDVQQGIGVPELLRVEPGSLAALDARQIDDLERRVRRPYGARRARSRSARSRP